MRAEKKKIPNKYNRGFIFIHSDPIKKLKEIMSSLISLMKLRTKAYQNLIYLNISKIKLHFILVNLDFLVKQIKFCLNKIFRSGISRSLRVIGTLLFFELFHAKNTS